MRALLDSRPAAADRTGIRRHAQTLAAAACGPIGQHELLDGRDLLAFTSAWDEELTLPALLEREGVDVFHSPLFHLPCVLPTKAVVTIHDAIPATHPELTTAAFSQLWRQAGEAADRADAVVCPTEAARQDVLAALGLPPSKVHVVPESPHPAFRPPAQGEGAAVRQRYGLGAEPFLLVLGALERRKNPALLLDALRSRPDLPRVVFVGPAGSVDLTGEAERHGVADRVRHLGVLPDADVVALLGAAEVLVFPTLAEGFGLPVVEAFATETPVVASAVPAVVEVAGDAALLFPPGDAVALASALARLVSEPDLARDLRARGQARLSQFTPEAVRAGLLRVYDWLQGTSAPGGA